MNRFLYLVCVAVFVASCTSAPKEVKVIIENPLGFDRKSEMVEIPVNAIVEKLALTDGEAYIVKDTEGGIVPSQITADDKLIFQAGVTANKTAEYTISKTNEPQEYKAKTYGRFIKERKDDFAWENDRVAFRIYGPALVPIDGPSNGIDAWYKRTEELVVDKWYRDDIAGVASYHEDHGEGQDDYKVGRSLGAGAMAPYVGRKLWLNENFASQELIENGPLRTTFKVTYNNMDVDGRSISETRTFSIDAGSQLTKITQEYGNVELDMPVAAGFVKRDSGDDIITSEDKKYLIYVEPESQVVNKVYLGLVFPEGMQESLVDTYTVKNAINGKEDTYSHVLGTTLYKAGQPVTYYSGFGWSKFGFPTVESFQEYIDNFTLALNHPLTVKLGVVE